jgi:uncharacterized protein YccT (UPF0319 family)
MSKSPITRNKTELRENKNINTLNANQSRVLSAPKIDKSKADKFRKNIHYQLDDFIGNRIPIGNKNSGQAKDGIGKNYSNKYI